MRRAPAKPVRACILRKRCPVSHVPFEAPLRTSHFSLHSSHSTPHFSLHSSHSTPHFTLHSPHFTLLTSFFTLHTPHFTLHSSHSTPHFTLHTSQSTLHTSHFFLHTPHSTLHTALFTLHSTLHTSQSTLHTSHFFLHTPHFTLHTALFTLHSTLHTSQSTLHTCHFFLHTPHFTLHTALFTLHSTLHTSHFTVHTSHFSLLSSHSTLHTALFTLHSTNSRQKRPQPLLPHTRGTFHRRLQPLHTEKYKVSCSGFLPKTKPIEHSCSHYSAFCSITWLTRISLRTWPHQMTTIMQPFHCDLQPQIQETHRTTHIDTTTRCRTQRRNQFATETTAAAPAAHTRYLSSPAATTLHGKIQGFVLQLPPQNKAH